MDKLSDIFWKLIAGMIIILILTFTFSVFFALGLGMFRLIQWLLFGLVF